MTENNSTNLSDAQKKLFEAIEKNDSVLAKAILPEVQNVNIVDENNMSPLQHSAYKGNKEIVQMLLDKGADVNFCEHLHTYTPLHFAGLSGNIDVCIALLLAGAKSDVKNTVGRTPSQMAAFVGHHNCVAVINNYVPKSDVEVYTTTRANQTAPDLPPFLMESFHKFVMQVNVHPVKIVLNVSNYVGLQDHLEEVQKVLKAMSEREMKRGAETNEVMSFKFHYLGYIVGEISKIRQRQATQKKEEDKDDDKKLDVTEIIVRKLLKPGKDGNLEFMDAFLRECVREFPHINCTLFQQMATTLTSADPPSALSVVTAAVNGQRGFIDNVSVCTTCGEEKPGKKCSKCKVVQYCDRNCQRLHWHWHKKACARLSQGVQDGNEPRPTAEEISADMQNMLVK